MNPGGPRPTRTSELLRLFADALETDQVSVKDIVDSLGDRGIGVLIAIFALPNIVPAPIPFGNVVFGIPVILFAVHLMVGVRHLILPGFIGKRTISVKTFKALAPRIAAILNWFERLLKPRLPVVTLPVPERVVGLCCIAFAIVSALPIPFAHNLPALGLVLIGLGLIERDGYAILAGMGVGTLGVTLLALVLFGLVSGLEFLAGWA